MDPTQTTGRTEATQDDIEVAFNLLNDGKSPEVVQGELAKRGLDQATAAAILRDFTTRAIYSDATQMLNNKVPPEDAVRQLVENGVELQFAQAVVNDLLVRPQAQAQSRQVQQGQPALQFIGGLVFVIGAALWIGNITGIFRTIPFAGFIVMAIGGMIARAGRGGR